MIPFPSPPPNSKEKAFTHYHYLALCVVSGDVARIREAGGYGGWVTVVCVTEELVYSVHIVL